VQDEAQRRVARNQALFRETNEAIERGQWPGEPDKTVRFRCECSQPDCNEAIVLSLAEYEQVRQHSHLFVVIEDHVVQEVEDVVGRRAGCVVVAKKGVGGAVAEARDPRRAS
jgi:hypothetical protein